MSLSLWTDCRCTYEHQGMVYRITFPVLFEELAIGLWLLIKDVKTQPLDDAASAPARG
jgi:hypothetical protein